MVVMVIGERWCNKVQQWLTISELAEQTNIPDTTIRRYIAKFPDFFTYKGGSRSRRYEDTAIKVLVRIKSLYDAGYETDQVDSILRKEFAVIIDDNNEVEDTDKPTPTLATAEDIADIKQALQQQMEFNKLLLERLEQQERYIRESLEKRDKMLMESIRSMQEERKALLEAATSKEKPSFWSRLFGGKR
jgi:DNA-binding transcriptional MerR regulator